MGAIPVLVGLLLGSFVALIGRTEATIIPCLSFTWSNLIGVIGALLGMLLWQRLTVNMSDLVACLTGAVIALDLYVIAVKYARRP